MTYCLLLLSAESNLTFKTKMQDLQNSIATDYDNIQNLQSQLAEKMAKQDELFKVTRFTHSSLPVLTLSITMSCNPSVSRPGVSKLRPNGSFIFNCIPHNSLVAVVAVVAVYLSFPNL